jgi:hypothetical protein
MWQEVAVPPAQEFGLFVSIVSPERAFFDLIG